MDLTNGRLPTSFIHSSFNLVKQPIKVKQKLNSGLPTPVFELLSSTVALAKADRLLLIFTQGVLRRHFLGNAVFKFTKPGPELLLI